MLPNCDGCWGLGVLRLWERKQKHRCGRTIGTHVVEGRGVSECDTDYDVVRCEG
jgi:hypothetical protein